MEKGTEQFTVRGVTYTVRLDFNSLAELEDLGVDFLTGALPTRVADYLNILYVAMRRDQPGITKAIIGSLFTIQDTQKILGVLHKLFDQTMTDGDPNKLAPFVPTPDHLYPAIFELLDLKPGELFNDLGCGNGLIVLEAHRRHPDAKIFGFELDPGLALEATTRLEADGFPPGAIISCNVLEYMSSIRADAVFCYLLTSAMERLTPLFRTMRPGARIVSLDFSIPELSTWLVSDLVITGEKRNHRLMLYTRPADQFHYPLET